MPEFTLDRVVGSSSSLDASGPEILFVQTGSPVVERPSDGTTLQTAPGSVVWLPAGTGVYGLQGEHLVWRSRVGVAVESSG